MKTDIDNLIIKSNETIQVALQKMSDGGEKMLLVVDKGRRLRGILTDGNVRRYIIRTGGLKGSVEDCFTINPICIGPNSSEEKIKDLMLQNKIEVLPVINIDQEVIGIERWCDQFEKTKPAKTNMDVPVVIMAGGKGTRLDPFTRILPKPLIPVGDKPIIEIIISRFREFGCDDFHISLNHKATLIKAYFDDLDESYGLNYIEEDQPLGTGGALAMLKPSFEGPFFLSNCDILVDADYSDILNFHRLNDFDITIVAAVKHIKVPYGVCNINKGGSLEKIDEKPTFDFLINTGMYVLNSRNLSLIPENKYMDFPDLIEKVRSMKRKVGVYPVEEKAWLDVGQWEEYHRSVEIFGK